MSKKTIIIGGAGFIGYHCAVRALREGHDVTLVDNLSRQGAAVNLASLRELAGTVKVPLRFCHADIRHHEDLVCRPSSPGDLRLERRDLWRWAAWL